jgi:hypothetical protein
MQSVEACQDSISFGVRNKLYHPARPTKALLEMKVKIIPNESRVSWQAHP